MKKIVTILAVSLGLTPLHAQTETEKKTSNDFNKWSIEVDGGFGVGRLENKDLHEKDNVGNFIAGLTGHRSFCFNR